MIGTSLTPKSNKHIKHLAFEVILVFHSFLNSNTHGMSVPDVSDVLKVQRSSFRCMDPSFDVFVAECSLPQKKGEDEAILNLDR